MNVVKKKNYQVNAELKTIGDMALVLEHVNGYPKSECRELAQECAGSELFEALLERNIELFKTGTIVFI